jgi:hypothetical protein
MKKIFILKRHLISIPWWWGVSEKIHKLRTAVSFKKKQSANKVHGIKYVIAESKKL